MTAFFSHNLKVKWIRLLKTAEVPRTLTESQRINSIIEIYGS